jgi:hypothetical protein
MNGSQIEINFQIIAIMERRVNLDCKAPDGLIVNKFKIHFSYCSQQTPQNIVDRFLK